MLHFIVIQMSKVNRDWKGLYKGTFQSFFICSPKTDSVMMDTINQTLDEVCKVPFSPLPSTGQQQHLMQGLPGWSLLSWSSFIVYFKRPNYFRLTRYLLCVAVKFPAYRSRLYEDSRNDQKPPQDFPRRLADSQLPGFIIFWAFLNPTFD